MHHSDNQMDVTTASRFRIGEHVIGQSDRLDKTIHSTPTHISMAVTGMAASIVSIATAAWCGTSNKRHSECYK